MKNSNYVCFVIGIITMFLAGGDLQAFELPFEYQFQHVTRENGLSQGTGYAINQDATGYIWFGTQEGLNRFDGRRIKAYFRSELPHALNDSYIYFIENDRYDPELMWLGTHGGLHSYNHRTGQFKYYHGQDGADISNKQIYSGFFVNSQYVWLATDYGLNYFDTKNLINQPFILSFPRINNEKLNVIYSLVPYDKNNLLLATQAGLFKFNLNTRKLVAHYQIEGNPLIWKIIKDINEEFWIGTSNGLYRLNKQDRLNHIPLPGYETPSNELSVYSLMQSKDQTIWVGSGKGVYFKKKQKQFILLDKNAENQSSIMNNTIWSIFEDNQGIVWFGTDSGISRYNPKSSYFHTLTKRADNRGLSDYWVSSIFQKAQLPLWVGTNNGIDGFDQNGVKSWHFGVAEGLTSPWVYSILQSSKDLLWVGTNQGLNRVDLTNGSISEYQLLVNGKNIFGKSVWQLLARDNNENDAFWIGSDIGLTYLNSKDGTAKHYSKGIAEEKGLTGGRVYSLHFDRSDNLWVGTSNGLNKIDLTTDNITQFHVDKKNTNGLNHHWITGISSDSANRLWISTDGGINFVDSDNQSFHQIEQFKPTTDYVYAVEVDAQDNIWFSTNSGIGRLYYQGDFSQPLESDKFQLDFYTKNDGLQANEYNGLASFKDSKGQIYFGGVKGLNMLIPEQIVQRIEKAPEVVISQLDVNGSPLLPKWADDQSPMLDTVGWTDSIKLNYEQNYLTFYLAALDFANPKENMFEYRLLGLTEEWQRTTDNQPFVSFHKLQPGDYQLQVRAATARSDWGGKVARLKIVITPPYWLSIYAYAVYLLIFVSVLVWFYQRNKLRMQRLQEIVYREQQVASRLKEVDAIKDQFLANASHELKTPLNAIIGLSDCLMEEDTSGMESEEVKETLALIKESGYRMNDLVEDILQCSTLSQRKLQIYPVDTGLYELVEVCIKEIKASRPDIKVELFNEISSEIPNVYADPGRIRQVILNLIGNSIKFTPAGKVTVSAQNDERQVRICVADSGIGIDRKYHRSIFDAFVQVDGGPSRMYEGSGLGLSIVKQLVELHGGSIDIESSLNHGTKISFTLMLSPVVQDLIAS